MRRRSTGRSVTAVAACTLLAGLVAAPAAAAPGDPAPGWDPRPEEAHREVAVADSGRVFVDASSEGGYKYVNYLEHGAAADWVRTPDDSQHVTHLATGADEYAVSVWHGADGDARYRLFDGTAWNEIATFYQGDVHASAMDGNSRGDVAVLLRLHRDGGTLLARLPRGGEWTVQEIPGVPTDVPADVVLNERGKTTVTWAAPQEETSHIMRTIVRAGSTDEGVRQLVGTVDGTAPALTVATDGEGRETIIGGDRLWRQHHTSRPHEYVMRTSPRAVVATGDTATRVVWPVLTDGRYELRTVIFDDDVQRPRHTIWSHPGHSYRCGGTDRLEDVALGVGMVPGGRSYVAVGIERDIETADVCPDVTAFLPVGHYDRVLNEQPLGFFTVGEEIQVAAGPTGPVAVEHKNWDDHADPLGEDQPDALYSLSFYRR